jgi:heme exporter protein A
MDTTKKLRVINLSCVREQQLIFKNIYFQLKAGELLLVEGPNGTGKSSLLRLLSGIATPAAGQILWQQAAIEKNLREYQHGLHYVGHLNGLKLGLSVNENIHLHQQLTTDTPSAIKEVLHSLTLAHKQDTITAQLSAGQKRRVALAKLFLTPKSLWLLDEPLTALDQHSQQFFLERLQVHLHNGGIAIISAHQEKMLSALCNQRLNLNDYV